MFSRLWFTLREVNIICFADSSELLHLTLLHSEWPLTILSAKGLSHSHT